MLKEIPNEATSHEKAYEHMFLLALELLLKNKVLLYTLYGILFSYFYNLPILKYSIKGDNEFRIYDVLGFVLIYSYYKYYKTVDLVIKNVSFFNTLRKFILWCCITMVVSLLFFIIEDALLGYLQVILYMYHFWVFYLAAVFFYIFCLDKNTLKTGVYLLLLFSLASCLIITLQNLGFVGFLWNDGYFKSYEGFLSGTLGPNKIVTGMTSLFVFSLSLGLLMEKNYKINKIVLYAVLLINIYIIFVSGSRTTYVGFIVVVLFFAVRSPARFLITGSLFSFLFVFVISTNPDLQKSLDDTFQKRIFNKTQIFDEDSEEQVSDAYSDLGSGRDELTKQNFLYLLENPWIIPFGSGFLNRFDKAKGLTAHNMHIQVVKETGLVGYFLYFSWLISYLFIRFDKFKGFSLALQGLVYSMLITLFFGEHLYIYRPLFGLMGLFLIITSIFAASLHKTELNKFENRDNE